MTTIDITADHIGWFLAGVFVGGIFMCLIWAKSYDDLYQRSMRAIDELLEAKKKECERCAELDQVHDQNCPNHPDHDPTPYCSYGHMTKAQCDCGPIARNN